MICLRFKLLLFISVLCISMLCIANRLASSQQDSFKLNVDNPTSLVNVKIVQLGDEYFFDVYSLEGGGPQKKLFQLTLKKIAEDEMVTTIFSRLKDEIFDTPWDPDRCFFGEGSATWKGRLGSPVVCLFPIASFYNELRVLLTTFIEYDTFTLHIRPMPLGDYKLNQHILTYLDKNKLF